MALKQESESCNCPLNPLSSIFYSPMFFLCFQTT
uniref:Uncharacterized protein n=1 Tax=Rhizophora mucronata TaxID=61149 RepID=A0A2P2QPY1_RHIMU